MTKNPSPMKGTEPRIFMVVDEGFATLPDEMLAARQVVRVLAEAKQSLAPPPDPNRLMLSLVDELTGSSELEVVDTAVSRLTAAADAQAAYEWRRRLVTVAADRATDNLRAMVSDLRDEIITNHLAPAVASTVEEARAAVDKLGPYELTDAAMVTAPKAARDGWTALRGLVHRYGALQGARNSLCWSAQADGSVSDHSGLFAEIRNTDEVWPQYVMLAGSWQQPERPPWADDDPIRRLVKILRTSAVIWCPTPEQQQQRWAAVYAERIAARKAGAHNLEHYRARFEGITNRSETPPDRPPGNWRKGPGRSKPEPEPNAGARA